MKYIQTNIKHLRNLKSLSQEQFAEELSWTRSIVGSYEEGRSEPPIDTLIELSNARDCIDSVFITFSSLCCSSKANALTANFD